jgi:CRP/FNR family cyclic AMP-dependent transcriptional regulator
MATISSREQLAEQLRRHALLRQFGQEELGGLVRRASLQSLPARNTVFRQGDQGANVLILLEGFIKLSAVTMAGREVVLDVIGPGDLFGELAVLNDQPRAATAMTLAPARLLVIDGRAFIQTLSHSPGAMLGVIRLLSRRLSRTTDQMTDVLELPAPARLAKAVLELAALHSHPVSDGLRISLPLSQRELGGMTGLIRESINKHLGQWRDAGWLSLTERSITLHDVAALRGLLREYDAG